MTSSLLVQAPTPAAFAARLRRRPDRVDGTLVPLQPDGTRPPLFVVAGGGGLGLALTGFARHLGPDRPTWALQAHALESRGRPDFSVAAAARRHLRALRRVQPVGPYHLAGHSFGGLVALELALRTGGPTTATGGSTGRARTSTGGTARRRGRARRSSSSPTARSGSSARAGHRTSAGAGRSCRCPATT